MTSDTRKLQPLPPDSVHASAAHTDSHAAMGDRTRLRRRHVRRHPDEHRAGMAQRPRGSRYTPNPFAIPRSLLDVEAITVPSSR